MTEHPRLIVASFAALRTALIPISIWQLVGTWRSAGRRKRERNALGRSAPWAVLARAATVLGLVGLGFRVLIYELPFEVAQWRIALVGDDTPAHQLRLLNGGTELEITGGIDFGTAADFRTLLDASANVRVIHLDNGGGRVAEALRVRDIIRQHKLATYAGTLCASACTLAYLGGDPRYLGPGAKLGFHRFSFPGLSPDQELQVNQDGERKMLAEGVTKEFAQKAFSTPSNDLWTPDAASLVAGHVVTQLSDGMAFAATSGGRPLGAQEAEAAFGSAQSLAALKRWDPVSYKQVVDIVVSGFQQGKRLQDVVADARAPLAAAVGRYRRIASDDVEIRGARLVATEARALATSYPEDCLALLYGKSVAGHPPIDMLLSKNIQQQDAEVTAAFIESGASNPNSVVLTREAAQIEAVQVWQRVRSNGTDPAIFGRKPETIGDQRSLCLALASFFDGVAALPRERAGALLRYFYANPG